MFADWYRIRTALPLFDLTRARRPLQPLSDKRYAQPWFTRALKTIQKAALQFAPPAIGDATF